MYTYYKTSQKTMPVVFVFTTKCWHLEGWCLPFAVVPVFHVQNCTVHHSDSSLSWCMPVKDACWFSIAYSSSNGKACWFSMAATAPCPDIDFSQQLQHYLLIVILTKPLYRLQYTTVAYRPKPCPQSNPLLC